ncbi:MAG: ASCH domain-containing protein [Clostridia bacterium]|nr:ASCH domain-containing protein [Clostridia bacterium]
MSKKTVYGNGCDEIRSFEETSEAVLEEKKQADHVMKLKPAPFAAIQSGKKTLELRLNDEKRQKIKIGDTIVFTQTETGEPLRAVVSDIRKYPDFEAMYAVEDPLAMGYTEDETADPQDMKQYYEEKEIKKYGTLAIEIRRIDI